MDLEKIVGDLLSDDGSMSIKAVKKKGWCLAVIPDTIEAGEVAAFTADYARGDVTSWLGNFWPMAMHETKSARPINDIDRKDMLRALYTTSDEHVIIVERQSPVSCPPRQRW